ncbi:MAG: hypothetical protein M3Y23_07035, partial [Actinomycetota bacterium]|nr:hypothetical protein [Actinomycetota bacterium]
NAFGTPAENLRLDHWRRASPLNHAGPEDPPFLMVVSRDSESRVLESARMAGRLNQKTTHAVWPVPLTHREINRSFGGRASQGETARALAFTNAVTRGRAPEAVVRSGSGRYRMGSRTGSRRVMITAGSRPVGAKLRCRLDRGPVHDCRGRGVYRVGAGRHRMQVRAYDFTGRPGPLTRLVFRVSRAPG